MRKKIPKRDQEKLKDSLKAIVFDNEWVMVMNDWDRVSERLAIACLKPGGFSPVRSGKECKDFFRIPFEYNGRDTDFLAEYRRGKINGDDFWNAVLGKLDRDENFRYGVENSLEQLTTDTDPDAVNVVRQLKEEGNYKLFMLSNSTPEINRGNVKRNSYFECFDKNYFSFEIGHAKPEREAYEEILREQDLRPEECLFIDDKEENLAGAKELGMHVLYQKIGEGKLSNKLEFLLDEPEIVDYINDPQSKRHSEFPFWFLGKIRKCNRWRKRSDFAKVAGEDFEEEVIGNLTNVNEPAKIKYTPSSAYFDEGAGAYKGDFALQGHVEFSPANPIMGKLFPKKYRRFSFRSGESVYHKKSMKHSAGSMERAGVISRILRKKGVNVPEVLNNKTRYAHDRHLPENEHLNVGFTREFLRNSSMESHFGWDENKQIMRKLGNDTEFEEHVGSIFDQLSKIYEDPDFQGKDFQNLLYAEAQNMLLDEDVDVKFTSEDRMSGKNLQEKIDSRYGEMLGFDPEIPYFKFHTDLVRDIKYKDEKFGGTLENLVYRHLFNGRFDPMLILGDLHPGNILRPEILLGEKNAVKAEMAFIDFDNAQMGIPYHDFVHFSVLSGFDHHPWYDKHKEKFLDMQDRGLLERKIGEDTINFLDFSCYASLLNRYHKVAMVESDSPSENIKPVHIGAMLMSCRVLYDKACAALGRYDLKDYHNIGRGDFQLELPTSSILEKYEKFAENAYKGLSEIEYPRDTFVQMQMDLSTLVPMAHQLYRLRQKSKYEIEVENIREHQRDMRTITDYNSKITGANIAGAAGLILGFGGLMATTGFGPQNLVPDGFLERLTMFGPTAVVGGALGYYSLSLGEKLKKRLRDYASDSGLLVSQQKRSNNGNFYSG
jgi:HAD superfamily hydrolase (TIGR01509 family)